MTNAVLGADNLGQYLKGFPAAASVIGRVANRIAKARFTLDGVEYNSPPTAVRTISTFCLETRRYPDSVNHPKFPSTILRPAEMFKSATAFRFSAK